MFSTEWKEWKRGRWTVNGKRKAWWASDAVIHCSLYNLHQQRYKCFLFRYFFFPFSFSFQHIWTRKKNGTTTIFKEFSALFDFNVCMFHPIFFSVLFISEKGVKTNPCAALVLWFMLWSFCSACEPFAIFIFFLPFVMCVCDDIFRQADKKQTISISLNSYSCKSIAAYTENILGTKTTKKKSLMFSFFSPCATSQRKNVSAKWKKREKFENFCSLGSTHRSTITKYAKREIGEKSQSKIHAT